MKLTKDFDINDDEFDYQTLRTDNHEIFISNHYSNLKPNENFLVINASSLDDNSCGELEKHEVKQLIEQLTNWLETGKFKK